MIIRLVMLAELGAITAALTLPESLQSLGLASFILATAAFVVAIFPSSAPLGLAKLLRPNLVVVLAAPALWMALQAVPMPVDTLGNPIWATASAALNEPLSEMITVDIGATMLSLAQYCAVLAAAFVTAVVTLDRYRAAQVLHILLSVTTIATAMWFGKEARAVAGPDGSTVAVLGVLLACATAIRAVDQLRRHSRPGKVAPAPAPCSVRRDHRNDCVHDRAAHSDQLGRRHCRPPWIRNFGLGVQYSEVVFGLVGDRWCSRNCRNTLYCRRNGHSIQD
ncbi:hypothetical protein [Bradyrhizobium sp. LM2.9]